MARVILTDGGMGQEILRRTSHPVHPLWSAQVMIDEPDIVRDAHADFIAAGARVITVNTYAATGPRLALNGISERFGDLQRAACRLAEEAREASEAQDVAIAGCLPPLVASYRPETALPNGKALEEYRRIAEAQAPHADLMLVETVSLVREGRAAVEAAAETGLPVWVAWCPSDADPLRLRSGETLSEALAAVRDLPVAAHLLNCCRPEAVDTALPSLEGVGGRVGAYANAFRSVEALDPGGTVDVLERREDLGPEAYATHVLGWVGRGATVVGGCCEVGPAHIAAIAKALGGAGHEILGPRRVVEEVRA